ncbi:MAG: hypothetical protein JW729_06080 [Bacteroidales bacterium]|nr:hypothetical protein [Bacteroidales bacterium]
MAERKKAKKEDIYFDEASFLDRSKFFLQDENKTKEETKEELTNLTGNYSELLDQVKLITRISDRLQRKLDQTNDALNLVNEEIQRKNVQLEQTINDLAEAKIGRRATTLVFIFAIFLFIVSEAFIEPWIETYYNNFFISLGIKGIIALLIKPVESLVERTLLKRTRARTLKAAEIKLDQTA